MFDSDQANVIYSDIQPLGMDQRLTYDIVSTPDGTAETNVMQLYGLNDRRLINTFGSGADLKTQTVTIIDETGSHIEALGMTKPELNMGITNFLETEPALYQARDVNGSRMCGTKVRQQFQRDAFQILDGDERDWDALWYYTMPCPETVVDETGVVRTIDHQDEAEFYALVINEQWQFRFTGDPLFINQGNSVTIVEDTPGQLASSESGPAGVLSQLEPGWWEYTRDAEHDDMRDAAELVRDLVVALDSSDDPWLEFDAESRFGDLTVVYSAGDADVYASFNRIAFDRQSDYGVNYRIPAGDEWSDFHRLVVRPQYNFEGIGWNDMGQNYASIRDTIKDLINDNGVPKNPNDSVLKEIERSGCQNCPNPTLEQILIFDAETMEDPYAITIRAFTGAGDTLMMFGPTAPPPVDELQARVAEEYGVSTNQDCEDQVVYNSDGTVASREEVSSSDCARLLREGALWNWITTNPDTFGFDAVVHFRVRNNSTFAPIPCTGESGGTCGWRPIQSAFSASYKFNTPDVQDAWAVTQLLGEVGVRTLGLSYASGKNAGSGVTYAMEQQLLFNRFYSGFDMETPFMLDSRADQLPGTLLVAHEAMNG